MVNRAYALLKRANAEFVVANDVSNNVFGSESNDVYIVGDDKEIEHVRGSKRGIACKILNLIK